ncbi:4-phosphopantetheinyl transferase [Streptomyces sp. Tu 6176]|uniref:4'-phosphopantetheinyl transferase family protein n=1 Tax=Streptomyces sp. Tu 6176 TaxID=1470557 RepID=UPI000451310D|nr:4'-phosphopantetheinyl transferase superfamily protein [Streptomyces sp. Tu 6176]EYT83448.1 4-phosphopantetheinyl transferase [Streptomyces sp. Tu 6176]CEK42816.1 4'-phosphopantetheinyl transferase [Streptomyces sp. Tu 6176]
MTTELWLLPEPDAASFVSGLGGERLLDATERGRLARMLTPRQRGHFLAGRLLCRHALSERTGHPVDGWRFPVNAYGRPEPWPERYGVRFSISHTDGLVVCAVTDGPACGVDVEGPLSAESAARVARFLAPSEQAELAALPAAERPERTRELWVLKEAYLKGLGTGVRRDLDTFTFTPRGTAPPRVRDPLHDTTFSWHFSLFRPTAEHTVALAVETPGPEPARLRLPGAAAVTGPAA